MNLSSSYPNCDQYPRKVPKQPINEDLRSTLGKNFRVLPLYEKAQFDHEFSKNHSLKRNEFLHCRWVEYQKVHIAQKPEPFQFPRVSDYHFYNYDAVYKPDLSINSRPNHEYWLKMGPGVDKYGEIPIPSDIGFRKTGVMVDKSKIKKLKKYKRQVFYRGPPKRKLLF
ncbi:uncharacterized protein [Epargyreus clarus]|uniref:uncharacterized protein n=1 Tax=Epargyreus clarus TaxID=520877 RepID=UPI003C2B7E12